MILMIHNDYENHDNNDENHGEGYYDYEEDDY